MKKESLYGKSRIRKKLFAPSKGITLMDPKPRKSTRKQWSDLICLAGKAMSRTLAKIKPDHDQAAEIMAARKTLPDFLAAWMAAVWSEAPSLADDEIVRPERFYPSGFAVKTPAEQWRLIQTQFPALQKPALTIADTITLTDKADGWFLVPPWWKLAATYHDALVLILKLIHEQRKITLLTRFGYRHYARTTNVLKIMAEKQGADVIIFPAQLGGRRKEMSIYDINRKMLPDEFGLDAFAAAFILWTHPERFASDADLWLIGVGSHFDYHRTGKADYAPVFCFNAGKLTLDAVWQGDAMPQYGLATGFSV